MNLGRVFEHEFMGHGVFGKPGGRGEYLNLQKLNQVFATPSDIVPRDPRAYTKLQRGTNLLYTRFTNGARMYFVNDVTKSKNRIKR